MNNDLKNCPFCGGKPVVVECNADLEGENFKGFAISCELCGITTPASDNEEEIKKNWNRRI